MKSFIMTLFMVFYTTANATGPLQSLERSIKKLNAAISLYDNLDVNSDDAVFSAQRTISRLIFKIHDDLLELPNYSKAKSDNGLNLSIEFHRALLRAGQSTAYSRQGFNEYFFLMAPEDILNLVLPKKPPEDIFSAISILSLEVNDLAIHGPDSYTLVARAVGVKNKFQAKAFVSLANSSFTNTDAAIYLLTLEVQNDLQARVFASLANQGIKDEAFYKQITSRLESEEQEEKIADSMTTSSLTLSKLIEILN